ncbi:MAG: hypothetical protein P8Z00_20065 [Anaerolineales bacterium]|jgi:hypothetical protein
MERFLGIVVDPAYVAQEGLNEVFDNLDSINARAIAVWPSLMQAVSEGEGGRVPDLHIDGERRLLARPLWGERALRVKNYLAYDPNLRLYTGTTYRPPLAAPAHMDYSLPAIMLEEAHRRGMQFHLGASPFTPPDVRTKDQPVRVDGTIVLPPFVARVACLNNLNAQAYGLAVIQDMLSNYPDADGLILDWAEFGAYRLEDHFTCFCIDCQRKAVDLGFNWDGMVRDVRALWDELHTLKPLTLTRTLRIIANPSELVDLLIRYPGWLEFLQFKARSVVDFYTRVRKLLDKLGFGDVQLTARGWCPPWNRSSGMDYHALAGVCSAVSPKLFTFDHAAMPRWYGETLQAWNPELAESDLLEVLLAWMNLPDDLEPRSFDRYHIPAPEAEHPANLESYRNRLEELVDQVIGQAPCYPIAHPYLPDHQWAQMVAIFRESRVDGMWVNMYGYLSDSKLAILREIWH